MDSPPVFNYCIISNVSWRVNAFHRHLKRFYIPYGYRVRQMHNALCIFCSKKNNPNIIYNISTETNHIIWTMSWAAVNGYTEILLVPGRKRWVDNDYNISVNYRVPEYPLTWAMP